MPKKGTPVKKVVIYSLVILIAIYSFFPIYWMFISSCRSYRALFSSTSLIPGPFSLKSYENLLGMTKYLINFKNSLWVAFVTTGITLICSILMSYVVTRYRM